MENERDFSTEDFAIGLASGLFIGAALTVLFAPASGSRTRHKISDWAFDAKLTAAELWERAKDGADKVVQKTESALGLQEKGLKKRLEHIKNELEHFDLSG